MEEVLEGFKIHEANPVATCCDHSNGGTEDSVGGLVPYHEMVSCLRYLMTGTCPDIAIAELHVAQAMDQPTEAEWIDVKLILRVFVKNKQVCCMELVTMREGQEH
jgi:hypothetical protein